MPEDERLSSGGYSSCCSPTPSPVREEANEGDHVEMTKMDNGVDPFLPESSGKPVVSDSPVDQEGGSEEGSSTEGDSDDTKPTIASIKQLFRYATKLDWLLMVLGAITAILHGFILPVALLFLDYITTAFTYYEVSRFIATVNFTLPLDFLLHVQAGENRLLEFSELINYDPDPNKIHVAVDILGLTGGDINCSETYTLHLPFPYDVAYPFTIGNVVRATTLETAICYDGASFLSYMDQLIVGLVCMGLMIVVLGSLQVLFFHTAAERLVRRIRLAYFHAALCQDRAWYDQQPPGEVSIRLSHNIEKIDSGLGINLSILIQWVSTFFAGLAAAFYKNWELTLILLVIMPLIVIPSAVFNRLTATFATVEQNHYASAGSVAEEVLSAIRTVVAFGGEHKEVGRYEKHLSAAKTIGLRRGLVGGLSQFVIYFTLFTAFGVSFWYGAYIVATKRDIGGSVLAVLFSVAIGAFYLGQSSTNLGNLLTAATAATPIFRTINNRPVINPASEDGVVPAAASFSASVEFRDVSFSYPARPGVKVLEGLNLSVGAGECVAVVGPSGGGKSTAVSLLQRFYDVTGGQVLIGGMDVRELNVRWLRSQIGIVSQEPILFNTSIRENIQLGHEGATMADIVKAAKAANAHNFIMALPNGYSTVVGEQGAMLSGGQKQRVAIARALVRDPKILLLDEATSALDTENEATLQEALMEAAGQRTVVLVTHRLPLVKCADRVVSVEGGRVEWSSTPTQLYARKDVKYQENANHQRVTVSQRPLVHNTTRGQTLSLRRGTYSLKRQLQEGEPKTGYNTLSLLWKVLTLSRGEWWILLVGVLAAAVSGMAFPIMAVLFGGVFEVFLGTTSTVQTNIHPWATSFMALGAGIGTAFCVRTLCFSVSGESLTHRVRHLTFRALLRQEIGWFDSESNDTGVLTSILSEDARNIQGAAGARLGTLVEGASAIILAHIVGLIYNWLLTLVLLFVVPLYLFSGWLHVRVSVGFASLRRRAFQEANDTAVECIENIETVASLGLEQRFYQDFTRKLNKPTRCSLALAPLYGVSQGVMLLGYIIAFRFGAYQITLEEDSLLHSDYQSVLRVFSAIVFASISVGLSGSLAPDYAAAKVSTRKILELLERQPDPDGYSEEGRVLEKVKGEVVLKDIYFHYPARPGVKVLRDLSITVPPGKTLALVGESGSGKSTIFALIERFYSPKTGLITLDGVEYKDLNIRWLRSKIGIVSQEPVLFDMSIADNIRYGMGNRSVSDEEVVRVAKAANIHDFISTLPQGYSTNVGLKGAQLSGGQKQRVAIARALLQDPSILLLDEATSALDDASERAVQAALERVQQGRTSMVITHRMATIENADVIVLLRDGGVAEVGTHRELMARGEHYHRMVTLQDIH